MTLGAAGQTEDARNHICDKLSWAVMEVVLISASFIFLSYTIMDLVHLSTYLDPRVDVAEFYWVAPMIGGTFAQLLLVLTAAIFLPTVRDAIRATAKTGNRKAWAIALAAALIHIGTAVLFFVKEPGRILEPSSLNALFSSIPAIDGWTQEVIFRGYVILRLAKAEGPDWLKIAISAALFAAIHIGYVEAGLAGAFWPLIGTAMLGGFLAWAVIVGKGALLPVVVAHALVIAVLQPWLALS
ncbi:type II CAAX prenyl endopeptidase Rce1 family protein [Qipengyuania sp. ASV99]|uniref:CPBP family glutamic-type intramembrane protease n=1 Tax=Qipengyuania sp. ASV99 TaxID=3399681 RepID=UPI003A4C7272